MKGKGRDMEKICIQTYVESEERTQEDSMVIIH